MESLRVEAFRNLFPITRTVIREIVHQDSTQFRIPLSIVFIVKYHTSYYWWYIRGKPSIRTTLNESNDSIHRQSSGESTTNQHQRKLPYEQRSHNHLIPGRRTAQFAFESFCV